MHLSIPVTLCLSSILIILSAPLAISTPTPILWSESLQEEINALRASGLSEVCLHLKILFSPLFSAKDGGSRGMKSKTNMQIRDFLLARRTLLPSTRRVP